MSASALEIPPLRANETIGNYRVLELMRRGNDYDVYDVWCERRQCRCVAKLPRPELTDDPGARRRLRNEARILKAASHPHIVRALEFSAGPPPLLITEALPGATLSALLVETPQLEVEDVAQLGVHLCSACHYLHELGYLHLDIKPSNIVVQLGLARLLDLSIARRPGRPRSVVGTDLYMAPEQATRGELSAAADVWGIGLVMYEAASGHNPIELDTESTADGELRQLRGRLPSLGEARRLPRALVETIDACLEPEPHARPPLAKLRRELEQHL